MKLKRRPVTTRLLATSAKTGAFADFQNEIWEAVSVIRQLCVEFLDGGCGVALEPRVGKGDAPSIRFEIRANCASTQQRFEWE
ncbi:hypothetical protein [Mesorhizobium mediterraneum]|uniref:hypothetical protein n=1 Tax=Mesorhizobium mediterraneum TaxID=43617 RepID=UPI0017817C27|nr:hypothetical protein [Mesorhizobium mediterraneum]